LAPAILARTGQPDCEAFVKAASGSSWKRDPGAGGLDDDALADAYAHRHGDDAVILFRYLLNSLLALRTNQK